MEFEELEVWRRSARLACSLYKELRGLRDFGFKDQVCRAAVSVPSNIAEGMERESYREQVRFLSYAKGSSAELRTQLYIAIDIGYIPQARGLAMINETKQISRMIMGLNKHIAKKLKHRANPD